MRVWKNIYQNQIAITGEKSNLETSNIKCDEKINKKKHRLWTRYLETKDPSVEQKYKTVRNLVKKESEAFDREQQRAVANNCKDNPKKFWKFINSKSKTSTKMGGIKIRNKEGEG